MASRTTLLPPLWVMAVLERVIYSRTKNAANAKCESSESSKVDNLLQIIHFVDLVKDAT